MAPLRFRGLWLAMAAGFVALVVYLSLTPSPIDVGKLDDVKTGHFVAYAWLMLWFAQLYPGWRSRLAVAAALVALGVGLEYAQSLTTYRTFGYRDMRDNALGVGVALALAAAGAGGLLARFEKFLPGDEK
ncbi:MAG TPA: VanZ family protein [Chloroflexota bacterium]|nr:VanZ family protein [Chloroflexota bacterium]